MMCGTEFIVRFSIGCVHVVALVSSRGVRWAFERNGHTREGETKPGVLRISDTGYWNENSLRPYDYGTEYERGWQSTCTTGVFYPKGLGPNRRWFFGCFTPGEFLQSNRPCRPSGTKMPLNRVPCDIRKLITKPSNLTPRQAWRRSQIQEKTARGPLTPSESAECSVYALLETRLTQRPS